MVSETARVRAPGRAKGKWAGQGRERKGHCQRGFAFKDLGAPSGYLVHP